MDKASYIKGAVAATSALAAGKRGKARAAVIDKAWQKIKSQGVSLEALTAAVDDTERRAAARAEKRQQARGE